LFLKISFTIPPPSKAWSPSLYTREATPKLNFISPINNNL